MIAITSARSRTTDRPRKWSSITPRVYQVAEDLGTWRTSHTARVELVKAIDTAWQRGWLPYDVREIVSRSLDESATSLVVDVIALSCSPHASSTVHPRWQRQLDEIGASVWWDGPLLEAWATRHIETESYASRTAARLLT